MPCSLSDFADRDVDVELVGHLDRERDPVDLHRQDPVDLRRAELAVDDLGYLPQEPDVDHGAGEVVGAVLGNLDLVGDDLSEQLLPEDGDELF